jgi:hypothetical protein
MDPQKEYFRSAVMTTVGAGSLVALGLSNPGPAFNAMFTTLALSSMIGYQVRAG